MINKESSHMQAMASRYVHDAIGALRERDPASINEQDALREDLGITSLEMISMLTDLCAKLGIDLLRLSEVDILKMVRVGDVALVLSRKAAIEA